MAVPWTYSAAGEVAERWDWLTDVLPPPTGEEQRRNLRVSPRITQEFDSLESAGRRRRMETAIIANGAGAWDVPIVQDTSRATSASSAGSTTISCDTTQRRFFEGRGVMIIGDDDRVFEIRTVDSMTSDVLTFTVALDRDWPVGTKVIPVFEGILAAIPALERFTGDDLPVRVAFELTEWFDIDPDAGVATYRGLPVMEIRPDWTEAPTMTPERRLAVVDNETSVPVRYDQPGIPFVLLRFAMKLMTRADIVAFWGLLWALCGRWAPIWVPTWAQDFLVTANLTAAATTLDVESSGFSDWDILPNRRDIRIELANGTVLYRRITSAIALDGDTERLTLNAALGVNANARDVVLVSFLMVCRQDTDTNLLRYWTSETVESELNFRSYLSDV